MVYHKAMNARKAYALCGLVSLLLCAAAVAVLVALHLTGLSLGIMFIVAFCLLCLAWMAGLAAFRADSQKSFEGGVWQIVIELINDLA